MATFVILRHPITILVTDFTYPNNLTNYFLILISLITNRKLTDDDIIRENLVLDPLAVQHIDNQLYI